MRAGAHEVDVMTPHLVNQQEVAPNMAFPVIGPLALQCVVQPLGAQGYVIGDQQNHGLFEAHHVVAPGVAKTLPVFQESLCVIRCPRQRCTFTGKWALEAGRSGFSNPEKSCCGRWSVCRRRSDF